MAIGTITRRMNNTQDALTREMAGLLDRKAFEQKIAELKAAGGASNRHSILAELFAMFDLCGISYERDLDDKAYEKIVKEADLRKFEEIEERIIRLLYEKYEEYPTPQEYMRRIVKRLSSPEDDWGNDSVRLQILKQFIKYGDYLNYKRPVTDAEGKTKDKKVIIYGGEATIKKYIKEKLKRAPKSTAEVLEHLDEGIFDVYFSLYSKTRADIESMNEQIKALNKMKKSGTLTEEAGMELKTLEASRKKLQNALKTMRQPDGSYGLIRLADDLANGKFKTGGATRRELYLFAMVYNMSYYSGAPGEIIDYDSDIEKNLFEDYYTNNLMRFITEAYAGKRCEYEVDPSGQGINYKNFVEMIYIYFISKDYAPAEKIRRASEMIERVKAAGYRRAEEKKTSGSTEYFMDLLSEEILEKSEEEFEVFLQMNYDCNIYGGKGVDKNDKEYDILRTPLQVQSEQNTAYHTYLEILNKLEKLGYELCHCNYGLWFTDVSAFYKEGCETLSVLEEKINEEQFTNFVKLLRGINSFLGHTASEEVSALNEEQEHGELSRQKIKAMDVSGPEEVTRTSMIVAYYYLYNAMHEEEERARSFAEVYAGFKKEIDAYLIKAHYQPLSGKNIFDIIVVFSAYAYINI